MVAPRRRLKPGFRIGSSFEARFSDDGALLVTLGMRPTVWDVAQRRKLGTTPLISHASHPDFSPDGSRLAVKNTSGEVMVVEVASLEEVVPRFGRRFGEGAHIWFSPCGEFLIDGSWSGHLLVRSAATGRVVWDEPGDDVYRLQFTRDRLLCVYERSPVHPGPQRHYLRRWPFWEHAAVEMMGLGRGRDAAITDDGMRLALQGAELQVYDISEPTHCRLVVSEPSNNRELAWHPTGDLLAAATWDRCGRVYTAQLETIHEEPLPYPSDVSWSPDGKLVAFGDWGEGIVLAWPPADG